MILAILAILCISVFPGQLFLLFRQKKLYIRLIPVMLILLCMTYCAGVGLVPQLFSANGEDQLAAIVAFCLCIILLIADGFAWLIFAVIQYVQKRRK